MKVAYFHCRAEGSCQVLQRCRVSQFNFKLLTVNSECLDLDFGVSFDEPLCPAGRLTVVPTAPDDERDEQEASEYAGDFAESRIHTHTCYVCHACPNPSTLAA